MAPDRPRRRLPVLAAHLAAREHTNTPLGEQRQGFGRLAGASRRPPIFDLAVDLEEAWAFFRANSFATIKALSAEEVAELNAAGDRWTREYRRQPEFALLFWPLLDYRVMDELPRHPRILPLVERALGGKEKVRFQQCNWRQYPQGYGVLPEPDTGRPPPASHSMAFHADSNLPDRLTRQPYWPLDFVSAFTYLTDTSSRTPALCVVPRSGQFETLTEAAEGLGEDYCELPIYAPAGTSTVMDSAILHTRLDGDGEASRRMLHVSYSRWSYERSADGWRGPATANVAEDKPYEMKALVPERLALSDDAAERLFYSSWTAWQQAWGKAGFAPEFRTVHAVPRSPDPALRIVDDAAC